MVRDSPNSGGVGSAASGGGGQVKQCSALLVQLQKRSQHLAAHLTQSMLPSPTAACTHFPPLFLFLFLSLSPLLSFVPSLSLSCSFFPPAPPLAASIKWINERASIEIWWSQHALALLLFLCVCVWEDVRVYVCVWVRHKGRAKSLIYNHLHPTGKSLGMARKKGKTAAGQRKTQEIRGQNVHSIRTFVCPVRKPIWGICKGRLSEGK